MVKRLSVASVLVIIILGLVAPVTAQGPIRPEHSDPAWQAYYWNNQDLSGSPVLERQDANINFDWDTGSPDPLVPADNFSARWTRAVDVTPGTYRFTVTSDDGIRVWIDDVLLLDEWYDHSAVTYTFTRYLGEGHHLIKVEYYENRGFAVAQLSWTRAEGDPGSWQAEYFNNMTLSGSPALERYDAAVNFDWGTGSPGIGVVPDHFSARWTRTVNLPADRYRFSLTIDDGGRLWVNGQIVIDEWKDQAATTYTGEIDLAGGPTTIELEYYEHLGRAVAKLSWTRIPAPPTEWDAEYYNNMTLSGSPAVTRKEAAVNFDWGTGSPAPGTIDPDQFSARWTRTVNLPANTYRFSVTVDDGARLWINGHRLIDVWYDQPATTHTGDMYLSGEVDIRLEYYENGGFAVAKLAWDEASGPPPSPGGTVIVDDRDPGFVKGGSPTGWRYVAEGYNGSLTWTRNNDYARSNYNWARWYPQLEPRRYEVYVFIPFRYTTTSYARYWVRHADGYTLRIVNQSTNGDRWVSLGTYRFAGDGSGYVSLADVTYEPRVSRLIAFDAVKWEPR